MILILIIYDFTNDLFLKLFFFNIFYRKNDMQVLYSINIPFNFFAYLVKKLILQLILILIHIKTTICY
jgi:hypothetical protein